MRIESNAYRRLVTGGTAINILTTEINELDNDRDNSKLKEADKRTLLRI